MFSDFRIARCFFFFFFAEFPAFLDGLFLIFCRREFFIMKMQKKKKKKRSLWGVSSLRLCWEVGDSVMVWQEMNFSHGMCVCVWGGGGGGAAIFTTLCLFSLIWPCTSISQSQSQVFLWFWSNSEVSWQAFFFCSRVKKGVQKGTKGLQMALYLLSNSNLTN